MKAAVFISLRKIAGLKTVINNFLGHCKMEVTHLTHGWFSFSNVHGIQTAHLKTIRNQKARIFKKLRFHNVIELDY